MPQKGLSILVIGLLTAYVCPSAATGEARGFECAGNTELWGHDVHAKFFRSTRLPSKGHIRVLGIFAKFKGEAPSDVWAPNYADDLFDPDVPGSFAHFYREMSCDQLSISGACLKRRYVSLHSAGYYLGLGDDPAVRIGTFVTEILAQVDRDLDFGEYDNDGPDGVPNSGDDDGYVDYMFLNLLSVPRGFLLSSASGLSCLGLGQDHATNDRSAGNGVIRISNRSGAIQRATSFAYAVGVMVHEFGHGLGLPDLYDASFLSNPKEPPEEDSAGIGVWGVMARGTLGWNGNDGPNPFSAWCREELGWIGRDNSGIVDVTEDMKDVLIRPAWDGGKVYRIPLVWGGRTGTLSEYFLIEYRHPSYGYYDRHLPGSGLLIWHVTETRDNTDETCKRVDLECADGLFRDGGYPGGRIPDTRSGRDNLDFWAHDEGYCRQYSGNLGDATDLFDGVRFTAFALDTNPASDSYEESYRDGSSGFAVRNIRRRGEHMMADFSVPTWYGEITGEATWGGTVQVTGDLTIAENATLVIQPGTQVKVATRDGTDGGVSPGRCEINVKGGLMVRGTSVSPVVFSSADPVPGDADWYGISLYPSASLPPDVTEEEIVVQHAQNGIFWKGHPDGAGLTVNDPPVRDATMGNGDGRANPGETFELEVSLGNWSFVTYTKVSVKIASDDPFVRDVKNPSTYTKVSPGGTQFSKNAEITIASDCPGGRPIMFSVAISGLEPGRNWRQWTGQFTLWVAGRDEIAPEVSTTSVSSKFVPMGDVATISANVQEPGPCTVVARIITVQDSIHVGSVLLKKRGGITGSGATYIGSWTPSLESDFAVYVEATDTHGNQGISGTPARFFSHPFAKTSDVLVYTDRTMREDCERALSGRGISYDVWDYNDRDLLDDKTLRRYTGGTTIWTLPHGTRDDQCLDALLDYLEWGGGLLLAAGNVDILRNFATKAQLEQFHSEVLRAKYLRTEYSKADGPALAGVEGDPIGEGFSARISKYGTMSVQEPAKSILLTESGNAAAVRIDERDYRAVYFAFKLSALSSPSDRENLIGGAAEWLVTRSSVLERDIALERVLAPERYTNKVALIPAVQIVNLGARDEVDVPVVCVIEQAGRPVYTDRQMLWRLKGGEMRPFSFRPWVPSVGVYEFTFYLDLPGDGDETNNVLTAATDVGVFLDVTSSAGIDPLYAGRGVAAGDYDRDGDLDIFVASYDGPDRLYRNDGGRVFSEVSSIAGVGLPGASRAGAWGDYDNDGDLDLYVSSQSGANALYRNEGNGRFADVTLGADVGNEGKGRAAVWGDYDGDGCLDLYLANADGRGVLYHNEGDGRFEEAMDVGVGRTGDARAATWWDYDGDGDLDLYVVAYGKGNALYRNERGGTFVDVTVSSGLDDPGKGTGLAAGDYDNDGDLDLYIAIDIARGTNRLYRNEGDGTFADATLPAGVQDEGQSIGVSWGDYDNDGWLDLYVANWQGKPNVLYRNEGDGTFCEVGGPSGVADGRDGYGVAFADYDNDGWLDLYVANSEPDVLYRNRGGAHHWLRVRTVGAVSNRDGIGCRVEMVAGTLRMIREISGGGGYCSQDGLWAQFGLGDHARVDSLVVRWPSGARSVLTSLSVDREVMVREPPSWKAVVAGMDVDRSGGYRVSVYPNPFNAEVAIRYNLPEPGTVRLAVYNLAGQCVRPLIDDDRPPGGHSLVWGGRDEEDRDVASGVYLLQMTTGEYRAVRKLVLMR